MATKTKSPFGEVVGQTENQKPIYEITKEIKVKLIDWDKITEIIKKSSSFNADMLENKNKEGIIVIPNKEKYLLIDNECIGNESFCKNMFIRNELITADMVTISFWRKYPKNENGSQTISIFPLFNTEIDVDILIENVIGEQELWEFMGSRYEYNPRISYNLLEIVTLYRKLSNEE